MDFFLSQSALKDLEREEGCPTKWHGTWVTGEITKPSTEAMDNGSYGEFLCLGSGAHGRETVTDLQRLKNGEKSAVQLRIEKQAERFRELFLYKDHKDWLGFTVRDRQIALKYGGESGVIDFDADKAGQRWIFDLKFTGDMNRNWGDVQHKDNIQLTHYSNLYERTRDITPHVGIIVFDFSPRMEIKFIELQLSKQKIDEKNERFNSAREVLNLYNKNGWTKNPSISECLSCPLECDKRVSSGGVIFEKIVY